MGVSGATDGGATIPRHVNFVAMAGIEVGKT